MPQVTFVPTASVSVYYRVPLYNISIKVIIKLLFSGNLLHGPQNLIKDGLKDMLIVIEGVDVEETSQEALKNLTIIKGPTIVREISEDLWSNVVGGGYN